MERIDADAKNCTGVQLSPSNKRKMLSAVQSHPADIEGDQFDLAAERIKMTQNSELIGTLTLSSQKETDSMRVFIDKLGERLAYERTGVRLYEAALAKVKAHKRNDLSKKLMHIKEQEAKHMILVMNTLKNINEDPTEMTPCADLSGVLGQGFVQVLTDPRTTITQMLNALLSVELTDNAAWELLIKLALKNEKEKIAKDFQIALEEEEEHLSMIKFLLEKELQLNTGHLA
ncbi:ferritin-like domain-containing protein [Legionella saoudiensis]|uniref:ferritin-like domain-containing protein n=1 Tax=Legionella saoudiensis TaxID=1750561 RepID=UPI000730F039|nr:ferritin-like domain-containing protein [Legionella saoudiensis]